MIAVAERTRDAVAEAARSARRTWSPGLTAGAAAWVLASVVVPFSGIRIDAAAGDVYLAAAAVPLGFAVGIAGMPVLGYGAFMGIGAFTAALLHVRAGWPFPVAAVAGASAAALAGVVAGVGVVRLRRVFVATTTWLLAWLVALFLAAFPSVSGGAQGLVIADPGSLFGLRLTPLVHFELAMILLALFVLGYAAVARERVGLSLSAARQRRRAAEALGVQTARLRFGTFVAAAAAGGFVGALAADLAGVADAQSYGIFLSLKLFVAVIVGGAASALGPPAGVAVIVIVFLVADKAASLANFDAARFDPALAAILILAVLALGGEGVVPLARQLLKRRASNNLQQAPTRAQSRNRGASNKLQLSLKGAGLTKRFGELAALDGLEIEVVPGSVHALVGPNGSGKTTALRLLAGVLPPDEGRVLVGDDDLTGLPAPERVRRGVAHTLQGGGGFPELTGLEHVLVGAGVGRLYGGGLRTLFSTPLSRAEAARARAEAFAILDRFGLAHTVAEPAERLSGPERALLSIAAAYATGARVLLLDEPGAGGTPEEGERLTRIVSELRDEGLALVLVEHDLRLVRSLADRVTVRDAGRVIASGPPDEVGRDPEVRRAYLGRGYL